MKLAQLAALLELAPLTPQNDDSDAEITAGYASDLLSDVLAHAPGGGVLVTLQVHLNVIAVASHANLCAVVFTSGRRPEDDVVTRAIEEGIALYATAADTFDVVGRMHSFGVKGRHA